MPHSLRCSLTILVALSIPAPALLAETSFFASDQAAWPIEKIADPALAPTTALYWLRIESTPPRETRLLYKAGVELERREIGPGPARSTTLEKLYKSGVLAEETVYGPRREMLEERHFDMAATEVRLLFRVAYSYTAGRLDLAERFDQEGSSQGTMRYRYDPRGRLLQLDMTGWFGSSAEGSVPGPALPRLSWASDAAGTLERIERYNESGSVATVLISRAGTSLSLTSYSYSPDGRLESEHLEDFEAKSRIDRRYDLDGNESAIETWKGGTLVESREFRHDAEGRLTQDRRSFPRPIAIRDIVYDEEGPGSREELRTDGVLGMVITRTDLRQRIEEVYAKGALVARAWFEDNFKVREEFLLDGKVLRERRYR